MLRSLNSLQFFIKCYVIKVSNIRELSLFSIKFLSSDVKLFYFPVICHSRESCSLVKYLHFLGFSPFFVEHFIYYYVLFVIYLWPLLPILVSVRV